MMEDSHFNSSYFWSPVPAVQGQVGLYKLSSFGMGLISLSVQCKFLVKSVLKHIVLQFLYLISEKYC